MRFNSCFCKLNISDIAKVAVITVMNEFISIVMS